MVARPAFALCALLLLLFGAACGATDISLHNDLLTRAEFDLICPKEKLTTTPLSRNEVYVNAYGVTGCGQRAVYLLSPGPLWSLNSKVEREGDATCSASATPSMTTLAPPPPTLLPAPPPPPPARSSF